MDFALLLPFHLLVLVVFANRYIAGALVKVTGGEDSAKKLNDRYEPTITIVIPMFNEGRGIYDTIRSLLDQEYPVEKLKIIVVDDCSRDDSLAWAAKAAEENPGRVMAIRNPYNMGKRRGINHAVRRATSEIIVSVDSDVIVDRHAVRMLVRRFTDPTIVAVGGRVNISNPHENWLTRMQTIKYYFGYEFLKGLERAFTSVMCLSGCLTAYRRSVLIELEPILENRNVLGVPIKYGEDRFLTRQIVKAGYRTTVTLDAICWTVAPNTLTKYFAQQLRWRRSNLVDYLGGLSHAWRLHPMVALHYFSMFALLIAYPVVVVHNFLIGAFFPLAELHLAVLAVLGFTYFLDTRDLHPSQRVHPLWFLGLGVLMPVTYLLYTPLALFTLDSSSWETRGHQQAQQAPTQSVR
jgi:N-acetylglucosaminyltransferase